MICWCLEKWWFESLMKEELSNIWMNEWTLEVWHLEVPLVSWLFWCLGGWAFHNSQILIPLGIFTLPWLFPSISRRGSLYSMRITATWVFLCISLCTWVWQIFVEHRYGAAGVYTVDLLPILSGPPWNNTLEENHHSWKDFNRSYIGIKFHADLIIFNILNAALKDNHFLRHIW